MSGGKSGWADAGLPLVTETAGTRTTDVDYYGRFSRPVTGEGAGNR